MTCKLTITTLKNSRDQNIYWELNKNIINYYLFVKYLNIKINLLNFWGRTAGHTNKKS